MTFIVMMSIGTNSNNEVVEVLQLKVLGKEQYLPLPEVLSKNFK